MSAPKSRCFDATQIPVFIRFMPRYVIGFPRRVFVLGKITVASCTKMYRRVANRCHQLLVLTSAALDLDLHVFFYHS